LNLPGNRGVFAGRNESAQVGRSETDSLGALANVNRPQAAGTPQYPKLLLATIQYFGGLPTGQEPLRDGLGCGQFFKH
jgi:hypothetical protein